MDKKIALVTGGNRGIGLGLSKALAQKGIKVYLGSRNLESGLEIQKNLRAQSLDITAIQLTVNNPGHIHRAKNIIQKNHGTLDILINNAGILPEPSNLDEKNILNCPAGLLTEAFDINTIAPLRICQAFIPLMQNKNYGRIVNISSSLGSISRCDNPLLPAYRSSKAALNMLTTLLSHAVKDHNILVNSVCPGWVKTDMGGENAHKTIDEGIVGPLKLCFLEDDGPSGKFFLDNQEIAW